MTLVPLEGGLYWPGPSLLASATNPINPTSSTVDAATEKTAHMGRLHILGRAAGPKTLSAAGGGKIAFRLNATTFGSGDTLEIGIQDLDASNGPCARPDGTFDVSRALLGGTDTLNANAWNEIALTGGSGSKSMSHGDLIAVVFDMTARSAGSVIIAALPSFGNMPLVNNYLSSAWQTSPQGAANILITFDDGTLAIIDACPPISAGLQVETFQDSTNPDERGIIFQTPMDCSADALWASVGAASNAGDFTLKLYENPLGTPNLLTSVTVLAEQMGQNTSQNLLPALLPSAINLTRNTDYWVTVRATGGAQSRLNTFILGDTSVRKFLNGGETLKKGTRQNDSGAATVESPAVTIPLLGVRISHIHNTAGGASFSAYAM